MGDAFQDPQWTPETRVIPNPMYTVSSRTYIPMIKSNYKLGTVRDEQQG